MSPSIVGSPAAPVRPKSDSVNDPEFDGNSALAAAVRSLLAVLFVKILRLGGVGRFSTAPPIVMSLPSAPVVQKLAAES
jgi:hypothetical protein